MKREENEEKKKENGYDSLINNEVMNNSTLKTMNITSEATV